VARYIWRANRDVPHLGVLSGDFVIFNPKAPTVWSVRRGLNPLDFGAVMAAEDAGQLELVDFTPRVSPSLRLAPSLPIGPRPLSETPVLPWKSAG
jgi:hypothetical protein